MVAVVSGSSLGLLNSSFSTLGARGVFGDAQTGRARQGAFVNAATGNLVLQGTDDYLQSRGLDVVLARTYNSQGLLDDDNGDGWLLGLAKKVGALTGKTNKAGSTITRSEGDGSASVYTYDAASRLYRSTAGAGATDTLEYRGGNWYWTDGDTGVVETYEGSTGRITSVADPDKNTTAFHYNSLGLIDQITDAGGDVVSLDYNGRNISQIRVQYTDDAGTHSQIRTRYQYDAQNRLSQVTTDLTPADGDVSDGNTFWTRYTYEGSSRRVSNMTQKDGSSLDFTYVQVAGTYRIDTVKDGENRLTRYAYDVLNRVTTVTDPLGNSTRYAFDAAGQLTQVTAPPVGGVSQVTSFTYSATGDLVASTDARGNTVTMAYDANGNQVEQRDAAGNTVRRVFSASNRVLVETLFTTPDADGSGPAQAAGALSTRYVYDKDDNLRFVVTPEGRVTEHKYDKYGQREATLQYTATLFDVSSLAATDALTESTLVTWSTATTTDRTAVIRTDYGYDLLGQLKTATTFNSIKDNGSGNPDGLQTVVRYTFSASGQLLQMVDGNNHQSSYAYDGLDRLIASTDAGGFTTTTSYDDAGNRTTVKLTSGLWTVSAYDRAGEVVSVTQSNQGAPLGTTAYAYDAAGRLAMQTDPTGVRTWHLYDAAGRKTADIDAAGSLVEYRYNAANQLTRTIRFARTVDLALLVDGSDKPTGPDVSSVRPQASADDRSNWAVYDTAGRLVQSISGEGYVTANEYDGAGRVVKVTAFATAVSTAPLGDAPSAVSVAASAADRVARNFYDKDGQLLGQLDGEGYLTTYSYSPGGQRVGSYAFARRTEAALRATGTLEQLLPQKLPGQDIAGTNFYDRKGRLVGSVDGEGYLTEQVYDLGGNLVRRIRYGVVVTVGATLDATRPTNAAEVQTWAYTYTALDQLATETSPDGTITRHQYDNVGNRTQSTRGWQSEDPRTATRRYDVQGRLVAELGGEGSARLALANTDAAIESVWAAYAQHYAYDSAGRRISSTDANGHRTLYFYDAHGQLAVQVNGEGEVQANSYGALGDLDQSIRYAARIDAATLGALSGGSAAVVAGTLAALRDTTRDAVTRYSYDHQGRRVHETDALGYGTDSTYRAFGVEQTSEQIDAARALVHKYAYDRRGLQVLTSADRDGVTLAQAADYDAFGRLTTSVDANGGITTRAYDRLGRQVSVQAPIGLATTAYDPFDRVTVQVDATGRATRTSYDTANRKFTVTLPDGSSLVTVNNRHGDKASFTDANGNVTSYSYDKDGRLKDVTDSRGLVEHHDWDFAGNELARSDSNGTLTSYSYDAANRALTQTVDPNGLNLVTRYSYDTAGRVLTVTDPRGAVTKTDYDAKGQARVITADAGGLNLVTRMDYDGRGRTLSVTDPAGRVTSYGYDSLGQRTSETIAGLTTRYFYDKAGNVTARQDAAGSVTRYVYDANQRKVYEIDGAGGVEYTAYDDAGRTTFQRQHAVDVSAAWLAGLPLEQVLQPADVAAQLQAAQQNNAQSASDLTQERILDANGRLAFTLDAGLGLTQYVYDANGNLVQRCAYANLLGAGVAHTYTAINQQLPATSARDRVTINRYDARNRLTRQFEPQSAEGRGALTVYAYDANGNVTESVTYASLVTSVDETPAASAADRRERTVYDNAGRVSLRATAQKPDGAGNTLYSVERFDYDGAGHVTSHRLYANYLASASDRGDFAAWMQGVTRDDGRDRVERFEYDGAGRLSRKTGAEGAVCDYRYDAAGNLVAKTEYASLTPNPADAANRTTRTVYDAAGRAQYEIDAEGGVTQRLYDGAGRVSKTIRYAATVNLTPLQLDAATVAAALRPSASGDRVEQSVFDSAGRLMYSIDAEGAVKRTDYDTAGHIKAVTRFGVKLQAWSASASPDVWSAAGVQAAINALGHPELQRTDTFRYGATGLLRESTDALGFTEAYTYDAVGNKLSFTNKSGATWDYEYDGAGRLLSETTPLVDVTPTHVAATSATRIRTEMTYDALGNLLARTEAANVADQSRTTRYEYDAAGRQLKTVYPQVLVADDAVPATIDLGRHEISVGQLSSRVEYDALGNAVMGEDVGHAKSYKSYDRNGRVLTETDALGGVTEYQRNAFGEVDRLTRKENAAASGRSIVTTYDRLGRAVQVTQPSAFSHDTRGGGDLNIAQTTRTDYDAFGDAVKTTSGGVTDAGNTFVSGITRYYYDRRSARVGQLAELDGSNGTTAGGYFTRTSFDADGNATEVTEYARLISGTDTSFTDFDTVSRAAIADENDRTLQTDYDALGRKRIETRVGRYTGQAAVDRLQTTYFYDAVGDLTATREGGPYDDAAPVTLTRYDALGRKTAVIAPTRADIDGANAVTPLTEFKLDAYGNVVERTDYAGGANGVAPVLLSSNPQATNYATVSYNHAAFDATRDRRTWSTYDAMGHKLAESDELGSVTEHTYDVQGHVARTWTQVNTPGSSTIEAAFSINHYDALGRLVDTITPGSQGAAAVTTHLTYNGFGELLAKTVAGLTVESGDYDSAGRVWRTRGADGVTRVLVRDAEGRVTQEITNPQRDLATAVSAADAQTFIGNRITETLYDSLGNAVTRIAPTITTQAGNSVQQIGWLQVTYTPKTEGGTVPSGDSAAFWAGDNTVQLQWPSLAALGAGDVKVEITYDSVPYADGTGSTTTQQGTYPAIFEASRATSGVTLNWASSGIVGMPGADVRPTLGKLTHVKVYKKDITGEWKALIDRDGTGASGTWLIADAPADINQSAELWTRATGGKDPLKLAGTMVRFGDKVFYEYKSAFASTASLDYEVRFGDQVEDSGTFGVVAKVGVIPEGERPKLGAGVLTWKAPAPEIHQRLRMRLPPSGNWIEIVDQRPSVNQNSGWIVQAGADSSIAIDKLPLGNYEYELLYYTGNTEDTLVGHANGTLRLGPQVDFGQGTDQAGATHPNVLFWPKPPEGLGELVELRTIDFSVWPPAVGAWLDQTQFMGVYGDRHGLALEGSITGPVQYQVSYVNQSGYAFGQSSGVVYVLPNPVTDAPNLPNSLAWPTPKPMMIGGVSCPVTQALFATSNGVRVDVTSKVQTKDGFSYLDLAALGAIDGNGRLFDYSVEWQVHTPDQGDLPLGSVGGRVRFGALPPTVVQAQGTEGAKLTFELPFDRAGELMKATLAVRNKSGGGFIDIPIFTGNAKVTVELGKLPAGDYEYRIAYQGKETIGGPLVDWGVNTGSFTTVPQVHFGTDQSIPAPIQALTQRALFWSTTDNTPPDPQRVTFTLRSRATGAVISESIHYGALGLNWIDLNGRDAGDYDYTLSFKRADGSELGTVTGTVRLMPEPAIKPGTAVLAWKAPQDVWPGQNVQQRFEVRVAGGTDWSDKTNLLTYSPAEHEWQLNLASLPPMVLDYRVSFVEAGGAPVGQSSGKLIAFQPPAVGPVAGHEDIPAAALSWSTPPAGTHAVFKIGLVGSGAIDYDALPTYSGIYADWSGRQGILLRLLAAGRYAYQVEYVGNDGQSFGKVQGTFKTAPEAQLSNVPAGATFAKDTPLLYWPIANGATGQITLQGPSGTVTGLPITTFTLGGQVCAGVDLSTLATGAYSYTLSFDAAGETMTSTGVFRHLAEARMEGTVLSWDAPPAGSGLTAVLRLRFHGDTTYGREISSGFTPLPDGRQSVNVVGLGTQVADYDYQVAFVDASNINICSTEGELRILPTVSLGALGATLLSWDKPPSGVTQRLLVRDHTSDPNAAYTEPLAGTTIPQLDAGHDGVNVKNMAAGDYDFKVEFMRDGQTWGTSTATVRVIPQPAFGNDGESTLSWTNPSAGITASVQVLRDGVPVNVTAADLGNGRSGVNLKDYPLGSYTFALTFTQGGSFFGETHGTFQLSTAPSLGLDQPTYVQGSVGQYLTWATPPAGWAQRFDYKNLDQPQFQGSSTTVPDRGNGLSGWDVSQFPAGRYDYTLTLTSPEGFSSMAHSQFTVLPDPTISASGMFSWANGADGEVATLVYYVNGQPQTVSGSATTPTYQASLAGLDQGTYPIQVIYQSGGVAYGRVDTNIRVVTNGDAIGNVTNKQVLGTILTITKATAADGNPTTLIKFDYSGSDTLSFVYTVGGVPHSLPVTLANGVGTIDVGSLPSGSYGYELVAQSASGTYSHATGTFTLNHAGETFTLPVTQIAGIYVNSSGQIRWPVPSQSINSVTFGVMRTDQSTFDVSRVPRQEGGEFVVDAGDMPDGDYYIAVVYQGTNALTGHQVWKQDALGLLHVATQTNTYTNTVPVLINMQHVEASGWPQIGGFQFFNLHWTAPDGGTGDFPIFTIPNPVGQYYMYDGQAYLWTSTNFTLGGVPLRYNGLIYTDDSVNHFGFSNVQAWVVEKDQATQSMSNVPMTMQLLSGTKTIAEITGYYSQWASTYGVNGSFTNTSAPYTPGYDVPVYEYRTTTYTTYSTTRTYTVMVPPITSVTDTADGVPFTPIIADSTLPPVAPTKTFGLLGTQDYYFYRGPDEGFRVTSMSSSGSGVLAAGSNPITHAAHGGFGSLASAQGSSHTDTLSSTVNVSHQVVTESASITASDVTLSGQQQSPTAANLTRQDHLFIPSNYSVQDQTTAGSLPVSLDFNLSWVDPKIDPHARAFTQTSSVQTKFDRWGDALEVTDARNAAWRTTYTYNAAGQVFTQSKPNEGGAASVSRATYDRQGHTYTLTDANNHTQEFRYDSAGNLIAEKHADGGVVFNRFDTFGNRTQAWVQSGSDASVLAYEITGYTYDLKGQLKTVKHADAAVTRAADGTMSQVVAGSQVQLWTSGTEVRTDMLLSGSAITVAKAAFNTVEAVTDYYGYDSLGRRVSVTTIAGGRGESHVTRYDLAGHVIAEQRADDKITSYSYDALGRRSRQVDASGRDMTWTYEGGSNLVATHKGLDGVTVQSVHDYAGELTREDSLTPRAVGDQDEHMLYARSYSYDARGQLTRIVDDSQAGVTQTTSYRYDAAGNRTLEHVESKDLAAGTTATLQDNHLAFDAQGRLATSEDGHTRIAYTYDAAGNRTRMLAHYINDSGLARDFDYGYIYDSMNRMLVEEGQVSATGVVDIAQGQGKRYTYDLQGRRTSTESWGKRATVTPTPYISNGVQATIQKYEAKDGYTTERYVYDAAGHLISIRRDDIEVQRRHYDLMGRLVAQEAPDELQDTHFPEGSGTGEDASVPNAIDGIAGVGQMLSQLGYAAQATQLAYESGSSRVHVQTVKHVGYDASVGENGTMQANVTYKYDGVGQVLETHTDSGQGITTTVNHYKAIGDADKQVYSGTTSPGTSGNVQTVYDGAGHILTMINSKPGANPNRRFYSDSDGRVLLTRHMDANLHDLAGPGNIERFTIVAGEQVARSATTEIEKTYTDSFGQPDQITGSEASAAKQATGTQAYVVQDGDTLQRIAQSVYGDSSLWYVIAQANGISSLEGASKGNTQVGQLKPGMTLALPDAASVGAGTRNSATTLRPYDPSQAIGDTSPNLPAPAHAGCGGIGQIIMVIVAIVVTFYTAGALSGFSGSFLETLQAGAGALGVSGGSGAAAAGAFGATSSSLGSLGIGIVSAAAGSVASQLVGQALGVQDHFSFKSVAASALSAGISSIASELIPTGNVVASMVARAAVQSVVSQGVNVLLGQQQHFSWAQVAASAVAAPLSQVVGNAADSIFDSVSPTLGGLAGQAAYGITRQLAAHAIAGGKASVAGAFSDSFGFVQGLRLVNQLVQAGGGEQRAVLDNAVNESLANPSHASVQTSRWQPGQLGSGSYGVDDVDSMLLAAFVGPSPAAPSAQVGGEPLLVGDRFEGTNVAGPGGAPAFLRKVGASRTLRGITENIYQALDDINAATSMGDQDPGRLRELRESGFRKLAEQRSLIRRSPTLMEEVLNRGLTFEGDLLQVGLLGAMGDRDTVHRVAVAVDRAGGAGLATNQGIQMQLGELDAFGPAFINRIPGDLAVERAAPGAYMNTLLGLRSHVDSTTLYLASITDRQFAQIREYADTIITSGGMSNFKQSESLAAGWSMLQGAPQARIGSGLAIAGAGLRSVATGLAETLNQTLLGEGMLARTTFGKMLRAMGEPMYIVPPSPSLGGGFDLKLKYKEGWTAEQRAAADAKVKFLTEAPTVVTVSDRSGTSAAVSRYKQIENVPRGVDVDHMQDLQLNGSKGYENLGSLDASVNRSIGIQIRQMIKSLPAGTRINKVTIED